MARLKDFYKETVIPKLTKDLGVKNAMQVPKLVKITVNMGVGEAVADRKVMDAAVADLTKITGQKPKLCMSKKSIASFKVRENLAIGTKVTLRGERMWEFFDRLVTIAIPRIRDFRGINPALSMAAAISALASRNRSFSRKSSTTRSISSGEWTSRSRRRRRMTSRVVPCSMPSISRSASKEP